MNVQTPQVERTVRLDAATAGHTPAAVRAVVTELLRREDEYGTHELEEYVEDIVHTEVPARLGALLSVPATGTTTLVTGGADAFRETLDRLPVGPADRIWTTPYEDVARLTALFALRDRTRCRLDVVPLDAHGDLDLEWMAAHIDEDVALVSVAHVPAGCGIVNPVEEIGRLLAPHRALYAVDVSYSVGQLPVNAARIGADLLTGDAWRFLGGPVDVGFACTTPRLRSALTDPGPARYGQEPPRTPHSASVAGLNTALLLHEKEASAAPRQDLYPQLRDAVGRVPGTGLIAPGRVQSAVLAFRHDELTAAQLRRELRARGIVLRKTVAQEMPLHLPGRGITTALHASLGHDTTAQDIARLGQALDAIVSAHRPTEVVLPRAVGGSLAPVTAAQSRPLRGTRGHLTLLR
ncbi:aminotransferase class V-fold PLP-dependent enzyme [Streptomyces sp. NBC_01789]|uniref:aminotransferase class V-fold PLP-dependent enzyme n=1 Tax=unclassified Streptomyces TaxID=2593676 RepID=UPI00224DE89B|nr:aminotransferase class V-fold PLP-dependent enzyme [Streptomyces sp. NBC_01789]MCX4451492.1 aminotransferase class V-fold PLP-dependent enzyme [Streptomyces sp. NBC_01789]